METILATDDFVGISFLVGHRDYACFDRFLLCRKGGRSEEVEDFSDGSGIGHGYRVLALPLYERGLDCDG